MATKEVLKRYIWKAYAINPHQKAYHEQNSVEVRFQEWKLSIIQLVDGLTSKTCLYYRLSLSAYGLNKISYMLLLCLLWINHYYQILEIQIYIWTSMSFCLRFVGLALGIIIHNYCDLKQFATLTPQVAFHNNSGEDFRLRQKYPP